APTSVDEVRDKLVNDIRRKAHYQVLLETVSDVEREVIEQGMLATAMSRGTGVSPVTATLANRDSIRFQQQFGQPTQATPTALPVVGPHEEATAAIIDRALELPQDVDFSELPIEQRVFTVPVEDSL